MFTINVYLRLALIVGGFAAGAILWAAYGFWYGFPFLLIAIVLLIGYLLLGTILSTNQLLSKMQLEEAEKRLKLTLFPGLLLMGYKGVYYMTHGALAMQKKDMNGAENWLKKALASGLPSDNERGAAMLQLAVVYGSKGNRQSAINQIAEIKKLNITEPMLREQIKDMEKQLKMMQQSMNPSMVGMMAKGFRPGSKRRQPRVR